MHLFTHVFIHSCIHSFLHLFIHPFIHVLIYALIHLLVHSFCSFTHSFIPTLIYSSVHSSIYSFIHALIRLFILGNGNTLQYFCRENPTDRGTCRAAVQGVAECRAGLSGRHSLAHSVHLCQAPGWKGSALQHCRGTGAGSWPSACSSSSPLSLWWCEGRGRGGGWLEECGQGKAPPHPAIATASNSKLPCTSQDSWGLCEDQKGRLWGVQVKMDAPGQSRRG